MNTLRSIINQKHKSDKSIVSEIERIQKLIYG